MEFGKKQLGEVVDWAIRLHFVVTTLIAFGVGTAVRAVLRTYTHVPSLWITPLWLFSAAATMAIGMFLWQKFGQHRTKPWTTLATSALETNKGIEPDFNLQTFFERIYNSDLSPSMEARVATWIDSGLIAYFHDETWWGIFKSQILALDAMNTRPLRREVVKSDYYDPAAKQFSASYANYTFDQWLGYLSKRVLILDLPGDTIGITQRGKDFLKHIVHYGYNVASRSL
jgi:hypothetical protein